MHGPFLDARRNVRFLGYKTGGQLFWILPDKISNFLGWSVAEPSSGFGADAGASFSSLILPQQQHSPTP
jgi:hypothetical protein